MPDCGDHDDGDDAPPMDEVDGAPPMEGLPPPDQEEQPAEKTIQVYLY